MLFQGISLGCCYRQAGNPKVVEMYWLWGLKVPKTEWKHNLHSCCHDPFIGKEGVVFESLTDIYRVIYLLCLIIKFLFCWSYSITWFYIWYKYPLALPGGSGAKNPPVNTGDMGLIPGSGRSPERGNGNPTPVFLPGESHRQRRLAGHSPWGHKEADTTQGLNINIKILTLHAHSERSLPHPQAFLPSVF